MNVGTRIPLEIYDRQTKSSATVMPATDHALSGGDVVVRFSAGSSHYELEVASDPMPWPEVTTDGASDTITMQDLGMTESQLQIILALAEGKLCEPHLPLRIPPSKEVAARLGWATTKFNRKLDNVCDKLTKAGVIGLKSSAGELTTDRRRRLVEYSIATNLVNESMLPMIDAQC